MPFSTREIKFRTARSGGKGGQNVNKVETMVEGFWNVANSLEFSEEDKERIINKLAKKINAKGELLVKSQRYRSQLENKNAVIGKMQRLVEESLFREKERKATAPTRASKQKRLDSKAKNSEVKAGRKKIIL